MQELALGSPFAVIEPPLSWWGLTLAAILLIIRSDAVQAFLRGQLRHLTMLAIQVSGVLVLAAVLGPVWWHFWMFEGWSGPPSWLSEFFGYITDGAAWSVKREMIITLCTLFTMFVLSVNLFGSRLARVEEL